MAFTILSQHDDSIALACLCAAPAFDAQVGLGILQADPHVFFCHTGRWNTIYYSELGASAAMLAAGYNIDCFMTRYQGVDWRDPAMWDCNKK